jgi:hypothetical protein
VECTWTINLVSVPVLVLVRWWMFPQVQEVQEVQEVVERVVGQLVEAVEVGGGV